jgi:enterobactin synthetase component D
MLPPPASKEPEDLIGAARGGARWWSAQRVGLLNGHVTRGHAAARLTAEMVRRGLPRAVGVGIRFDSDGDVPELHPNEQEALGPNAVEKRRMFFALGRAAARAALRELELPGVGDLQSLAIGRGAGGEPLWPPGVVGAISHAGDVAVALVGRRSDYAGLGVDVEELGRGPSPRTARLICRPSEMEWADPASGSPRLAMLFSAKEAVFKAVYPIEHIWLGFSDAELTWHPERSAFEARLMKTAGARLPVGFALEAPCTVTATQVLSTAFC